MGHTESTLHIILVVMAFCLFTIGAVAWTAPFEPWRGRIMCAGLACWVASTFF